MYTAGGDRRKPARSTSRAVLLRLATVALCIGTAGCGGGDGDGGGLTAGGTGSDTDTDGTASAVNAGDDLTISANSVTIDATSAPAEGETLTYIWRLHPDSPRRPVAFDDAAVEDPTVHFPFAGEYILELSVDDGEGTSSDAIRITVDPADAFGYAGTVLHDGAAATGQPVALEWTRRGGITIADAAVAADGSFGFADLIGDADAFTVVVPSVR